MRKNSFLTRHRHRNMLARRLTVGLLALLLALLTMTATGCSGQILLPDGTVINADGSEVTGRTDGDGSTVTPTESGGTGENISDGQGTKDPLPFPEDDDAMYVEFLDTGKSDAILIRMVERGDDASRGETVILLDTGDADDYDLIAGRLTSAGVDTIDYMILSHLDNDHIGSADRILQTFTVKTVYMPDYVRQSSRYRALAEALAAVSDRTEVHRLCSEDVRLDLGMGKIWMNASSLYDRGLVVSSDNDETLPTDENNFSIITSVYFGDTSLFLPGDAERERMEEFNALHQAAYTLIKTPHHGSSDRALESFVKTSGLSYAVMTAEGESSVDADLALLLRLYNVELRHTFDGDILFATNGTETVFRQ